MYRHTWVINKQDREGRNKLGIFKLESVGMQQQSMPGFVII